MRLSLLQSTATKTSVIIMHVGGVCPLLTRQVLKAFGYCRLFKHARQWQQYTRGHTSHVFCEGRGGRHVCGARIRRSKGGRTRHYACRCVQHLP